MTRSQSRLVRPVRRGLAKARKMRLAISARRKASVTGWAVSKIDFAMAAPNWTDAMAIRTRRTGRCTAALYASRLGC